MMRRLTVVALSVFIWSCADMAAPEAPTPASCGVGLFPTCRLVLRTSNALRLLPGDSAALQLRVDAISSGRPMPGIWVRVRLRPEDIVDARVTDSVRTNAQGEATYRLRMPERHSREAYILEFLFAEGNLFTQGRPITVPVTVVRSPSVAIDLEAGTANDTVEVVADEPRTITIAGVDRFGNRQAFQGTVTVSGGASAAVTCVGVGRYMDLCRLVLAARDTTPARVTLSEDGLTVHRVIRAVPRWTREVLGGDIVTALVLDGQTVVGIEQQPGRLRAVAIDGAQVTRTSWVTFPVQQVRVAARRGVVVLAWRSSNSFNQPIDIWRASYGGSFERVPGPPLGVVPEALAVDDSGRVVGRDVDGRIVAWNGVTWTQIVGALPFAWGSTPFGRLVADQLVTTSEGLWRIGTGSGATNTPAPRTAFAAGDAWMGVDTALGNATVVSSVASAGDELVVTRRRVLTGVPPTDTNSFDATVVRYYGRGTRAELPELPRTATGTLPTDAAAHASVGSLPVVQLRGPGLSSDPWRLVAGQWRRVSGWAANSAVPVGSSRAFSPWAFAVWTDANTVIMTSSSGLVRYRLP